MNNTISRTENALPLSDDHGKVVGYFFPARIYERWQTRVADLNRQVAGSPNEPAPVPDNGAPAPGPVPFDELLDMLKGLADADRLRLLLELKAGPRNVGALAQAIGTEIVNASHHLSVLRNAKVVLSEKQGRYVNYRLNPHALAMGWMRALLYESEITFADRPESIPEPPFEPSQDLVTPTRPAIGIPPPSADV
jgi:DNA-binding transcriptional ArsR family regulator